jgi:DNA-binding NarL/FixJ family response regulator
MNIQSILILEDTATVRRWLCGLVMNAFPGCAIFEAATLSQAMASIQDHQFDLALIDINLPDGNGITLLSALRQRSPQTYCIIATIFDDDENVFRALQAGAHGYLLKDQQDEKLLASLKGILNNEPPLSPSIALRMLGYFRQPQPAANNSEQTSLSEREREILTLIAKGMNRAEIAHLLAISPATVATHIGAIYRKLKISSRSEAAVEAVRLGLITP